MDRSTECRSTEEMIAAFEDVNSKNGLSNLIVGSMDVKALYPSLLADETAAAIREEFENVDIKIEGVNWAEAGKLLTICLEKTEIERLGLEELVCKRKKEGKKGRKIGITSAEVMGKLYKEEENQDVNSLFDPPMRPPTPDEERKVFRNVIELAIVAAVKQHDYQSLVIFENKKMVVR